MVSGGVPCSTALPKGHVRDTAVAQSLFIKGFMPLQHKHELWVEDLFEIRQLRCCNICFYEGMQNGIQAGA